MEAEGIYRGLMIGTAGSRADPFDCHVVVSILALTLLEAAELGTSLAEGTGLDATGFAELACEIFPNAAPSLPSPAPALQRGEDETCLLDLLCRFSTERSPLEYRLAAMIARRAQRPNHLWQDLGLRNRGELSRLMQRHFAPLARRNVLDMKWKKFLYRTICRDEGYAICTAPSCAECDDFDRCFGDESGDSLLARVRRKGEQGTVSAGF